MIVVIGSGFLKEDFIAVGREEAPDIFKESVTENSGQGGMTGIHEAIIKGSLPKALAQIKLQEEMTSVEKLREALSKDLATYGNKEVENAIALGAAESMLILSEKTKTKNSRKLLDLAEQNRTKVIEISSNHHGGEMLSGLGDIAVILRYRLT